MVLNSFLSVSYLASNTNSILNLLGFNNVVAKLEHLFYCYFYLFQLWKTVILELMNLQSAQVRNPHYHHISICIWFHTVCHQFKISGMEILHPFEQTLTRHLVLCFLHCLEHSAVDSPNLFYPHQTFNAQSISIF